MNSTVYNVKTSSNVEYIVGYVSGTMRYSVVKFYGQWAVHFDELSDTYADGYKVIDWVTCVSRAEAIARAMDLAGMGDAPAPQPKKVSRRRVSEKPSRQPKAWQVDPANVQTAKVQYWRNGVCMSDVALDKAREMVANGSAFVISAQAIGALNEKGEYAS